MRPRRPTALRLLLLAAMLTGAGFREQAHAATPVWKFQDVSSSAGIAVRHELLEEPGSLTQRVQAGVAVGDYDRDGLPDVFIATGNALPQALLRNRGDGSFEDVGERAGVALEHFNGAGPLFFDYDGDGFPDLFLGATDQERPVLFHNTADGRFEDVTEASGLELLGGTVSATAGDYDGDGFLDLFLSHWGEVRGTCHLWRNVAGKRFECQDEASGMPSFALDAIDRSFTANFADLDDDGHQDLLITSDFGTSRVLRNLGDGRFEAQSSAVISDENGMGAALGDYDGDGKVDWFVTSIWDADGVTEGDWGTTGNRLYRGLGNGSFEDATDAAGVREGDWGWSACFADLNNDGALDLAHVTGWPQGSPQFRDTPARLFVNVGDGSFREQAAELGFAEHGDGRALACFDYDLDGDVDLLVMNNGGPARLWQNVGGRASGAYLSIVLEDRAPNTHAIGAQLKLRVGGREQTRLVRAGSNYAAQDAAEAHFGLGNATSVESLQVTWPDGEQTTLRNLEANQRLTLSRPNAAHEHAAGCSVAW
jgi:hypothetical protein